jgi:hypothetical protein
VQEGSKAEGKKACQISFLTFFNWWVIWAALHLSLAIPDFSMRTLFAKAAAPLC